MPQTRSPASAAPGAPVPGRTGGQHRTGGGACLPTFSSPNSPPLESWWETKPKREHAVWERQAVLSCHFPSFNYRQKLTLLPVPNSDAKSATLAEARSSACLCWDLRVPEGWVCRARSVSHSAPPQAHPEGWAFMEDTHHPPSSQKFTWLPFLPFPSKAAHARASHSCRPESVHQQKGERRGDVPSTPGMGEGCRAAQDNSVRNAARHPHPRPRPRGTTSAVQKGRLLRGSESFSEIKAGAPKGKLGQSNPGRKWEKSERAPGPPPPAQG